MASKYDRLTDFMNTGDPKETLFEFSFEDLEKILGEHLPRTARKDRVWWEMYKSRWLIAGWRLEHVFFKPKPRVVFQRQGTTSREPVRGSGKSHLEAFLRSVPEGQDQVPLTFSEVGETMGHPLPATALNDRTWWANTKKPRFRPAWVSAGWEVQSVYMKSQRVVFRRVGSDVMEDIAAFVAHVLEGRRIDRWPARQDLEKWLRICARVGWHFEGTVLVEKGGGWEQGLGSADRACVDEDYEVCKRECNRHRTVSPGMQHEPG